MQLPAWVDKGTKDKRASSRLKFVLNHLALHHTGRNSMRALAETVGLDHSTLSGFIRNGACSDSGATLIIAKLRTKLVKHSDLTDPLSIKA